MGVQVRLGLRVLDGVHGRRHQGPDELLNGSQRVPWLLLRKQSLDAVVL